MELFLQFGYGMMGHTRSLIQAWGGGTVLLSPRDLNDSQITRLATDIHKLGGRVLVDPQVYLPRADHHRLIGHDYWPSEYSTAMLSGGAEMDSLIERLKDLNERCSANGFIIPGLYNDQINADWLAAHENLIETSSRICMNHTRWATVCVSNASLRNEDEIEVLINACENWDVSGFYVVPEHPNGDYLVEDPVWLTNLLLLTSGLHLLNKEVLVGYCSHQMLSLAATGTDAICSGTWLNVRSFPPSKFQNRDEDEQSRRTLWYYCPQALSEFKLPFLDMGYNAGVLNEMRPIASMEAGDTEVLFSGAQPSSTAYNEQASFKHYLHSLHYQTSICKKATYRETLGYQFEMLDEAETLLEKLRRNGVRGQTRDFAEIIDVNRSALTRFNSVRGFVMERTW